MTAHPEPQQHSSRAELEARQAAAAATAAGVAAVEEVRI